MLGILPFPFTSSSSLCGSRLTGGLKRAFSLPYSVPNGINQTLNTAANHDDEFKSPEENWRRSSVGIYTVQIASSWNNILQL